MILINKLSSEVADDLTVAAHACRDLFWEVADLAAHVRSRARTRRALWALADREQHLYGQLGRDGYALLIDGISVERTPQIDATLKEIRHSETRRHQHRHGMSRSSWDIRASMSSVRLTHLVRTGEWRIHAVAVTQESPWIDRELTGETPTGVCLAVRRDQSLHPLTWDWRLHDGDLLMVLAPSASFSDWDQWITQGSTDTRDTR